MIQERPVLAYVSEGRDVLEEALDRERRALIRADEARLARYQTAARDWAALWPEVARQVEDLTLREAHSIMTSRADGILPFAPQGGDDA